jgi:mRNA deadenylase 3'-5' endonuclease subunit Ccr4
LVTGLYGNKFNGYMGVATAVPVNDYDILAVDITKIADTKKGARRPRPTPLQKILSLLKEPFLQLAKALGLWKPAANEWKEALRRHNEMISVRLRPKRGGRPFVLGTYHMPCVFYIPSVMMIHCALSAQHLHKLAKIYAGQNNGNNGSGSSGSSSGSGSEGKEVGGRDPYVFVGDFNIKPDSNMYRMLTTGGVEASCSELPVPEEGDTWECKVNPMGSAYASALGSEPKFTNWSKVKEEAPFVETLDYIFYSDSDWEVKGVADLKLDSLTGPFPIADEPSDHLLLSAELSLK